MKKYLFLFALCFVGSTAHASSTPVMCTMDYTPVCGSVQVQCIQAPCDPVRQTYGNACTAGAAWATNITKGECESSVPGVIVGGDQDIHGCIGSAGYSWSASAGKCVRPWEVKMSPRAALQSGTWNLVSLNGKAIDSSATIKFEKNRFHAKICNIMNGNYGVLGSTLIFRNTMSTMMYCEGDIMKVENALSFTRAKFMVGSDTLTITTKKGDVIVWKK